MLKKTSFLFGLLISLCVSFSSWGQSTIRIAERFEDLEDLFTTESDSTFVINLWATWCKPCVEELPYFESLQSTYANEKVEVILISLDFKNQYKRKLIPFVEKNQLQSTVVALWDANYNDWIDKVDPSWEGAIPVTLFLNKENKRFIGKEFESSEDLHTQFADFVKQ